MADSKISDLATGTTPLVGTEEIVSVQSGTSYKFTTQDVADLASGSNLGNSDLTITDNTRTITTSGALSTNKLVWNNGARDVFTILGDGQVWGNLTGVLYSATYGEKAGLSSTGLYQTLMGYGAGQSSTGNLRTAVGLESGGQATGADQTFLGGYAGYQATGTQTVCVGKDTGFGSSSPYATFIGMSAGRTATGSYQVSAGWYAGYGQTGNFNVNIGGNAGRYITGGASPNSTGASGVFIGLDTRAKANGGTNEIAIGTSVTGLGSNSVNIGDSLKKDSNDNVILGTESALATTATNGFQYCRGGAGVPTGTPATAVTGHVPMYVDTTNDKQYIYSGGAWVDVGAQPTNIAIACSDETTALAVATGVTTFRMPHAMTVTEVRASLTTAPTTSGLFTVDINEGGTSILSTKITIDLTEKTSTTAATAPVISDSALADDAEITIDIDAISGGGTEAGLKIYLIGTIA